MKLINKDKIKSVPLFRGEINIEHFTKDYLCGVMTVIQFIDTLPSIDSDELNLKQTASWNKLSYENQVKAFKQTGTMYDAKCTYCNTYGMQSFKFCPKCGREMRTIKYDYIGK